MLKCAVPPGIGSAALFPATVPVSMFKPVSGIMLPTSPKKYSSPPVLRLSVNAPSTLPPKPMAPPFWLASVTVAAPPVGASVTPPLVAVSP